MLDIQNSQTLQQLSNTVVKDLAKYRNKDYPAPSWVKFYPNKLKSFEKYGSPNTFAEFNPHLTKYSRGRFTNRSNKREF